MNFSLGFLGLKKNLTYDNEGVVIFCLFVRLFLRDQILVLPSTPKATHC